MSKTVIFFGSGPVAAKSLELISDWCDIEAVITKPKPLHHKDSFPVIETAKKLNLPLYEAQNQEELAQLFENQSFTSEAGVVIDYGIIIPKQIIDRFPLGIVNSHFSLLPELRGADPISYAILQGKNKTGVSLMLINEKMDEGMLLSQKSIKIDAEATTPDLTNKLINLSDALLQETLPKYTGGKIKPYPQNQDIEPTYSTKITKDQGIIDWNQPARVIERQIRAFAEWPKSHANIGGNDVIIAKTHLLDQQGESGKVSTVDKKIIVFCGEGAIEIDRLKPLGKNEMSSQEFLAGYKVSRVS